MGEFVRQLPALVGVVVGVLASYLASVANERLRWRRDVGLRWDERRIAAYAEYGNAVKRIFQITLRIMTCREANLPGTQAQLDELLAELHRADNERAVRWESVLLVGAPATVAAARSWHHTIWKLDNLARRDVCDRQEWIDAVEQSREARSRFYEAARADLGLVGQRLPEPVPWRELLGPEPL